MNDFPIIRVVSKFMIPYILLFAMYVQFHGDFGPGGGFQAGVIFASAIILYGLVYGLAEAKRVAPEWMIEKLIAFGLVLYAGTGFACLALGGNFLDYDVLDHHVMAGFLPHQQHLGIFVIELGVGITVTSVMVMIYYAFAARERTA
jgi:multicomponent Na+:H+ antiporter subunit B